MTKKPVMRRPRIWKRDVPLQGFIDWLARESFKPGDACEMTITCKDAQYCVMDCRAVQQGANVAPACVHCGAPAGFRHDWMCKTRDAERSSVQSPPKKPRRDRSDPEGGIPGRQLYEP